MDARIGLSLERARGYSGAAARAMAEPLPSPPPMAPTVEEHGIGALPSLLPHQRAGVEWVLKLYYNGLGGVLADEMGLGKTVQVASFFATLLRMRCFGTHLVVAPLVTLDNWEREVKKWCPLVPVIVYHGTAAERESKRRWLLKRQREAALDTRLHGRLADTSLSIGELAKSVGTIVITSYETVLAPNSPLGLVPFDSLVVDEAHRLKNRDCKLIRVLRRFRADTRLLLTGTPLQNDLTELWSIINFVMPAMFPSAGAFGDWVDEEEKGSAAAAREGGGAPMTSLAARRMQTILRPFVLRRTKADIEALALPPKIQIILRIGLSEYEQTFYNRIRRGDDETLKLSNRLVHLRRACCHPFLFDEESPFTHLYQEAPLGEWSLESKRSYFEALLEKGSKLRTLHSMLVSLRSNGHRVLVFSQFTTVLDLLEDYLYVYEATRAPDAPSLTNCRLDGSNSREEKGEIVAAFTAAASGSGDSAVEPPFCFLISTRSGGVGINLTSADTVVLYDGDFNPQNDYQAIDRCHRIGQTRPVAVYRLVCSDTVEEAMLRRALTKVRMDRALFAGGEFARLEADGDEPSEGNSGAAPMSEEERVHKMTMAYNFGAEAKGTSGEELQRLLDRRHLCEAHAADGDGRVEVDGRPMTRRVRFE